MDRFGPIFQNIAKNGPILTNFPKYRKKWDNLDIYPKILQKQWINFTHFPKYCKKMTNLVIFSKMLQKVEVDQFEHILHNIAKSGSILTHLPMQSETNANIAAQGWNSYLILCHSLTISPKRLMIIFSQQFSCFWLSTTITTETAI